MDRGLECPGYDRNVDAWFCDETANVEKKARKTKLRDATPHHAPQTQKPNSDRLVVSKSSSLQLLSVPIEDQAFKYFLDSSAVGIEQPPLSSESYHQHLSTNGIHPLVATTMTALGMAGLANLCMDPGLKRQATQWYLKSIKMMNAAIADPVQARNDVTLVSIHLSSMFEATSNDKSLSGWANHVHGAASLVKMRGKDQFSTLAGRRMYIQTIALLTQSCVGQGIALPDFVQELNREAAMYMDLADPRHRYFFLHIETANLRARICSQKNVDLQEIIERALELDAIAASIFEGAGAEWHYHTIPCSHQETGIFGDQYHVYPTHATAQAWNWVRYNRIYYHDIIRNCILVGFTTSPPTLTDPKYNEMLGTSTQILQKLQSEILASMPQFLNDSPKVIPADVCSIDNHLFINEPSASSNSAHLMSEPSPTLASPHITHPARTIFDNFESENVSFQKNLYKGVTARDRLPIIRISGGYSTIWPLYVAGAMPTASKESQEFVMQSLCRISEEFGVKHASVLRYALGVKRGMENGGEVRGEVGARYLPEFNIA